MTSTSTDVETLVTERKSKLLRTFDLASAQGILPLTNREFHEMANSIVRSALFAAIKSKGTYAEWSEIFSLGGTIRYKGPQLTVNHEMLFTRIHALARGQSLTKPVIFTMTEALGWLGLSDSGPNRKKVRELLDDLKDGDVRVACKATLNRIYNILTRSDLERLPDGQFLKKLVENRYSSYLPAILENHRNDEPFEIDLSFITRIATQGRSRRIMVELDPMMALLFDGVNTTLLPFEVWDELDQFGKKFMCFVASHGGGVYNLLLENYHNLSGSKSSFEKVKRRFKSEFMARLRVYEEKNYIEPGWDVVRSREGDWLVIGIKGGPAIKIRSELRSGSPDPLALEPISPSLYDAAPLRVVEMPPEQRGLQLT